MYSRVGPLAISRTFVLAIDDFDVDFLLVVVGVAVLRRSLDAQAIHAAAVFGWRDVELDRHHFAAPPSVTR